MLKVIFSVLVICLLVHMYEQAKFENSKYLDFNNPVRSAATDEITSLPGLEEPINFRHYSGYLEGADYGQLGSEYLHYWFAESQNDPTKDPILLWLNGGPGCSSLSGLFTELGPFEINADGKTLNLREYSWNRVASVLFLESPTEVGFSYLANGTSYQHTDDSTAKSNHLALKSFFKKFPQYKNNPLYLSGESYAGVYLPTLGVLLDQDPEFNLKGIAIGNGYLDAAKLSDSLVFFSYYHGLIGNSTWHRISKDCCNGQPPSRETCTLSGKNSTWSCGVAVGEVDEIVSNSGLNPYNLYDDCLDSSQTRLINDEGKAHISRETIDRALLKLSLDPKTHKYKKPFHVLKIDHERMETPCTDDHLLINYLNMPDVRNATHIPREVQSWDICTMLSYKEQYAWTTGGLTSQMQKLIDSKRNLTILVYNGDVDMVCNFLGNEWFVDDLSRKLINDYSAWHVEKQVAGFVKHYEGITFVTVRGSGHIVPKDRPEAAFSMIQKFLDPKSRRNVLVR